MSSEKKENFSWKNIKIKQVSGVENIILEKKYQSFIKKVLKINLVNILGQGAENYDILSYRNIFSNNHVYRVSYVYKVSLKFNSVFKKK